MYMDKNMIQRWIHTGMVLVAIAVLLVSCRQNEWLDPSPRSPRRLRGAQVQRRYSCHGESDHPCGRPRWWRRAGHDAVLFRQLRSFHHDCRCKCQRGNGQHGNVPGRSAREYPDRTFCCQSGDDGFRAGPVPQQVGIGSDGTARRFFRTYDLLGAFRM